MLFGTAGIPAGCAGASSAEGIACVARLGLDAMELEFVHGVRLGADAAEACRRVAEENKIRLSCHAPYYINLLTPERDKLNSSRRHILESCRALEACGGGRVVFHPGYYLKLDKKQAFELMTEQVSFLKDATNEEGLKRVALSPETTGKHSAFGSLEELLALSKATGCPLTIDFAHLHARSFGGLRTRADYARILDAMRESLGAAALKDLHCHFSGIAFTAKGEAHHLPVSSESPPFAPLAHEFAERKCAGTVVCESPLIEKDALLLKRVYENERQ
ncbi:MAG: TIM barrel protein [Candidatus Micrarchaeia archaeon]